MSKVAPPPLARTHSCLEITMSLKTNQIQPVPEETARVAHAAFPKGNAYLTLRDQLDTIFQDEDFLDR